MQTVATRRRSYIKFHNLSVTPLKFGLDWKTPQIFTLPRSYAAPNTPQARKMKKGRNQLATSLLWALTDSNRRPSACKADALNQLS